MFWLTLLTFTALGIAIGYKYRQKIVTSSLFLKFVSKVLIGDKSAEFSECDGNFAMITYKRRGRTYQVFVPYNKRKINKVTGKLVYLIKDEDKIDITQQPGVEYMLTAKDMKGKKIVIYDQEGETVELGEDVIPFSN